jgi:hypothetical protein
LIPTTRWERSSGGGVAGREGFEGEVEEVDAEGSDAVRMIEEAAGLEVVRDWAGGLAEEEEDVEATASSFASTPADGAIS